MINVLFATIAVGHEGNSDCLHIIETLKDSNYDENDEFVVITDNRDVYKDVESKLKITVLPYYLPKELPRVDRNNYEQNTLVKLLIVGDLLYRDDSHELFYWLDHDQAPVLDKQLLQSYANLDAGLYYDKADELDSSPDNINNHEWWVRGERYLFDMNMFTSVWGTRNIDLHKNGEGNFIFPNDNKFIIKRKLNDTDWSYIEKSFYNHAHDLLTFCLMNYFNDNNKLNFEMNMIANKTLKLVDKAPHI